MWSSPEKLKCCGEPANVSLPMAVAFKCWFGFKRLKFCKLNLSYGMGWKPPPHPSSQLRRSLDGATRRRTSGSNRCRGQYVDLSVQYQKKYLGWCCTRRKRSSGTRSARMNRRSPREKKNSPSDSESGRGDAFDHKRLSRRPSVWTCTKELRTVDNDNHNDNDHSFSQFSVTKL